MKKAIIYASVHHGNTEKLVKSIAEECQVDLIDAVKHLIPVSPATCRY